MREIFEWPWMVGVAAVAAVLVLFLIRAAHHRRMGRLTRMGTWDMVMRLVPAPALRRPGARALRLAGVVLLVFLGMAGPRWGEEERVMRGEGIDVVLAMDASLSMLATDESPSRLERLRQEVRRIRAASRGDRFALLAFAGRSYILSPLTTDEGALDLFLDNLDPSVVGQAGSAISTTITQGTELLEASRSAGDRALIILSDGESFDEPGAVMEAALRAGKAGIAVITVGFGTTKGSTIPIRDGNTVTEKLDDNGDVVVTRYHPETLRAIATNAGGTFIDAATPDKAGAVRNALRNLQTTERIGGTRRSGTPRFQLFVLPALILIVFDSWGRRRRERRDTASRTLALGTASLVLLAGGCVLPAALARRGEDQFLGRKYAAAAASFRAAVDAGDQSPRLMYNLGTALVSADSNLAAIEPLERALSDEDPEVRYRALFNIGLAHLKTGMASADGADSTRRELAAAVDVYKQVLLMRPGDRDARWNYELALRDLLERGGSASQKPDPSGQDRREPEPSSGDLGRDRAEQLLNSAARDEQEVQGRKQKASRPKTQRRGKDW